MLSGFCCTRAELGLGGWFWCQENPQLTPAVRSFLKQVVAIGHSVYTCLYMCKFFCVCVYLSVGIFLDLFLWRALTSTIPFACKGRVSFRNKTTFWILDVSLCLSGTFPRKLGRDLVLFLFTPHVSPPTRVPRQATQFCGPQSPPQVAGSRFEKMCMRQGLLALLVYGSCCSFLLLTWGFIIF